MTRSALALVAVLCCSCAPDLAPGRLLLTLEGAGGTGPMADPGTPMLDGAGIADLSLYPLFAVVRVEAADLHGPVVATWPEVVPEASNDLIVLELVVAPGQDRRVSAELFLAEDDGSAWMAVSPAPEAEPLRTEVEAGTVRDVELELAELPVATVRAGWDPGADVATVTWVDERGGVALPPSAAEDGAAETELSVGRYYWPRVSLADGATVDLDRQRLRPEEEGVLLRVTLELD